MEPAAGQQADTPQAADVMACEAGVGGTEGEASVVERRPSAEVFPARGAVPSPGAGGGGGEGEDEPGEVWPSAVRHEDVLAQALRDDDGDDDAYRLSSPDRRSDSSRGRARSDVTPRERGGGGGGGGGSRSRSRSRSRSPRRLDEDTSVPPAHPAPPRARAPAGQPAAVAPAGRWERGAERVPERVSAGVPSRRPDTAHNGTAARATAAGYAPAAAPRARSPPYAPASRAAPFARSRSPPRRRSYEAVPPASWQAGGPVAMADPALRPITLTDASYIFLRRAELEQAAARADEDIHSFTRGALVRVRDGGGLYCIREVYRARVTSRGDPELQLLMSAPDRVFAGDQVSNAPPTLQEWRSFQEELAGEGRAVTLRHALAVCHNLGRPPPPSAAEEVAAPQAAPKVVPPAPQSYDRGSYEAAAAAAAAPPGDLRSALVGGRAQGGMGGHEAPHTAGDADADRARRRSERFGGPSVDTRVFSVPQGCMGVLVGKQHASLLRLQETHGVRAVVDNPRSQLAITGAPEAVEAAIADCTRSCARVLDHHARVESNTAPHAAPHPGSHPAATHYDARMPSLPATEEPSFSRMVDAQGCLGAVIGSKGRTVHAIQMDTGARVDKVPETGHLKVSGTRAAVEAACERITTIVAKAAARAVAWATEERGQ